VTAFAQAAGVAAHPHLLRHSLASAMAAAKEPASVIAGQLRHADGGTLASRTYIHQLPDPTPSGQAHRGPVRPGGSLRSYTPVFSQVRWGVAGPGFEPG
jgi:integrase